MIKFLQLLIVFPFLLLNITLSTARGNGDIKHNPTAKTISIIFSKGKLGLMIDYSKGCTIKELKVADSEVLSANGIYTGIKQPDGLIFTSANADAVQVTEQLNGVTLSGISYGSAAVKVNEVWRFKLVEDKLQWTITRTYDQDAMLDGVDFPKWNFANMSVWKGGIMDNGGMVWCKYLRQVDDTYGVHTGGVTFWSGNVGDAISITAKPAAGNEIASSYSHSEQGEFTFTHQVTAKPMQQRYGLSRFVSQRADVFAPVEVKKGKTSVQLEISYLDYDKTYSRGTLKGIDATAVRELMNTTGRYGVVDNGIVGANGWLTNWKCLHEPFFAQIGMALNDENYTKNMAITLDQERDRAMLPDGRVLSRWHNAAGDEMPGTYDPKTGYYEAKWGYTVDSQTGYVINASEQFDLTGDVDWLRKHQLSCEKALDWLIKRDANHNGIFEMMNDGVAAKTASDWLDIVWASYENAFVNAQLYEALTLWSNCEQVLGNKEKSRYYTAVAARLKEAFNQPIENGGFWSAAKQQYVYWRDKDGTVHGDNLVTPVNFAAIAFGICDDPKRIAGILDQIENRTTAEHLFHWPLCFDSFKRAEVSDSNWPFPKYENGDIFPTWGYLGIRAYAKYNKTIALKYIHKLLEQYNKDGLSSQRYNRVSQTGEGDDVLAGICTSITALYRDIYGIRPQWNRMGLEPNMDASLNGTMFSYNLRGVDYRLELSVNDYLMKSNGFSIRSKQPFGAKMNEQTLLFYPYNRDEEQVSITETKGQPIDLKIEQWQPEALSWKMLSSGQYRFRLSGLQNGARYQLWVNGKIDNIIPVKDGLLSIRYDSESTTTFVLKKES